MVGLWLSYLHVWTYFILHQYLADLGVAPQCCPVQNGVTVQVHQIHTCWTWIRRHFSNGHLNQLCFLSNSSCPMCPPHSTPQTLDQRENDVPVTHLARSEQRRVLHHIHGVDHGFLFEQKLHCAHVAGQGGGVQRCENTEIWTLEMKHHHFLQNKLSLRSSGNEQGL